MIGFRRMKIGEKIKAGDVFGTKNHVQEYPVVRIDSKVRHLGEGGDGLPSYRPIKQRKTSEMPGFRRLNERETIQDGDVFLRRNGTMEKSASIGCRVGEDNNFKYFRPIMGDKERSEQLKAIKEAVSSKNWDALEKRHKSNVHMLKISELPPHTCNVHIQPTSPLHAGIHSIHDLHHRLGIKMAMADIVESLKSADPGFKLAFKSHKKRYPKRIKLEHKLYEILGGRIIKKYGVMDACVEELKSFIQNYYRRRTKSLTK